MLHVIWMFDVGVVVGAIARWIMPGTEGMGILMTGLLGIAGSFVGGFIARLFSNPPVRAVEPLDGTQAVNGDVGSSPSEGCVRALKGVIKPSGRDRVMHLSNHLAQHAVPGIAIACCSDLP